MTAFFALTTGLLIGFFIGIGVANQYITKEENKDE